MEYAKLVKELEFEIDGLKAKAEIYHESIDSNIPYWSVFYYDRYGHYWCLMTRKNRPRPSEIKKRLLNEF